MHFYSAMWPKKLCKLWEKRSKVQIAWERCACIPIFTVQMLLKSYVFLKYMPNFLTFTGGSQELIRYMKDQNNILDRDIRSWSLIFNSPLELFYLEYHSLQCLNLCSRKSSQKKANPSRIKNSNPNLSTSILLLTNL